MFFQKKFKDPSNSSKLNAITSCCVHLSWNTSINFAKRFSRITWPLVDTYPLDKHSNLMQLPNVVYRNNCMLFRNNYKLPDCNLMLKIRTKILFFFSRIFMLRKGKGGKRAQQTRNHTNIHTPQQRHRNSAQKDQSCTFVLQEKMTINYRKQILWSFDVLTQWITFVNMWYVTSVCSLTTQNHNVEFHEGKSNTQL